MVFCFFFEALLREKQRRDLLQVPHPVFTDLGPLWSMSCATECWIPCLASIAVACGTGGVVLLMYLRTQQRALLSSKPILISGEFSNRENDEKLLADFEGKPPPGCMSLQRWLADLRLAPGGGAATSLDLRQLVALMVRGNSLAADVLPLALASLLPASSQAQTVELASLYAPVGSFLSGQVLSPLQLCAAADAAHSRGTGGTGGGGGGALELFSRGGETAAWISCIESPFVLSTSLEALKVKVLHEEGLDTSAEVGWSQCDHSMGASLRRAWTRPPRARRALSGGRARLRPSRPTSRPASAAEAARCLRRKRLTRRGGVEPVQP